MRIHQKKHTHTHTKCIQYQIWVIALGQKFGLVHLIGESQDTDTESLRETEEFCILGAVEDEDHLLLVCPAHHDIRCKFGQQLGKQLTPCSLLPELMHSANPKAVALYLVSCLDNRSVLLKSTM
jgi:hypothetical protein